MTSVSEDRIQQQAPRPEKWQKILDCLTDEEWCPEVQPPYDINLPWLLHRVRQWLLTQKRRNLHADMIALRYGWRLDYPKAEALLEERYPKVGKLRQATEENSGQHESPLDTFWEDQWDQVDRIWNYEYSLGQTQLGYLLRQIVLPLAYRPSSLTKAQLQIVDAITALGGEATPKQVAGHLGRKYDATKQLMNRMARASHLLRNNGKYRLTPKTGDICHRPS